MTDRLHPKLYATFHALDDDRIVTLRNDVGESITIMKEAAGDIALMMADWCKDPDLAEFVANEWQGTAEDLREFPEGDDEPDYGEEMTHLLNTEAKVDLGGGMVVPLAELLEDDEEESTELLDQEPVPLDELTDDDMTHARMADRKDDP